jgi:RNA polymerase sigma-70 factor (ECF subfamily)
MIEKEKPPTFTCVRNAWKNHEAELHRFLVNRLSDPHLADDLLQEVFFKAVRHRDSFCNLTSTRAWLFEVARNTIADHFRSCRKQVDIPDDLPVEADEPPTVDSLAVCIPRVLTELSEQDREAIVLCDLQGMTQEAFAQLKGLSISGAKSRVQRARKRLQDQLTKVCQVEFDENGQVMRYVPRVPAC